MLLIKDDTINAKEEPRIRQDRQKVTLHRSANPREIPTSAPPLHTQKQCTARGPLGVFHPCL